MINRVVITMTRNLNLNDEWHSVAYEAVVEYGDRTSYFYGATPEITLAKTLAALMERNEKEAAREDA